MIQEQQQQTNQWVLTSVQFNLVGATITVFFSRIWGAKWQNIGKKFNKRIVLLKSCVPWIITIWL